MRSHDELAFHASAFAGPERGRPRFCGQGEPSNARRLTVRLAALLFIVCADAARAQTPLECDGPIARYDVLYRGGNVFDVQARFARPTHRVDLFHFPVLGRPQGQSESVSDLVALDGQARPIDVQYIGEGSWSIAGEGAVELRYSLHADHSEVDWGAGGPGKDEVADFFDGTFVFAGHAFFLQDWEMPRCPVEVRFDLPDGWQVTAPWRLDGDVFRADESWSLGQNMFAIGLASPRRGSVGGLNLTWIIDQRLASIMPQVEAMLSDLPAAYTEFWGAAPGDQFNIYFMSDHMSDGGAFYDSFAMRIATPLSAADEISWSHTLGHELMHLWNTLGTGNVSELEWVNEGFTDYLTLKIRSRTGQLETAVLEQRIANLIRRYRLSGAMSPGVSLVAAGVDKMRNWHLIYGGGALAALLIDAELSQSNPQRFSQVLQTLRRQQGEGYTYESFMRSFDDLTSGLASDTIAWLDNRPSDAELIARLRRYGIDVSVFNLDEVYVRFAACDAPTCTPGFLK